MNGKILVRPKVAIFSQHNDIVVDYLKDDPNNILMAFSPDDNNLGQTFEKWMLLPAVQRWFAAENETYSIGIQIYAVNPE